MNIATASTSASLRLLERLDALTLAWAAAIGRGGAALAALANVAEQRALAGAFLSHRKPAGTDVDVDASSADAPLFLQTFPDAVERLVCAHAEASRAAAAVLLVALADLRSIAASINTLARDAAAKAGPLAASIASTSSSAPSPSSSSIPNPSIIPLFVAAEWIDSTASAYSREVFAKEDVLHRLFAAPIDDTKTLKTDTIVADHQVFEAARRQWDLSPWLDLALETRIRDRVRLAKRSFIQN